MISAIRSFTDDIVLVLFMAKSAFYPYSIISQLCINNLRLLSHRPGGLSFITIKIPCDAPPPCTSGITAEGIQNRG